MHDIPHSRIHAHPLDHMKVMVSLFFCVLIQEVPFSYLSSRLPGAQPPAYHT